MPRFYSKVLKGTLEDFVKDCLDMPPHEQLDCREDLHLIRHSAMQSVALYQLAVDNGDATCIAAAATVMQQSLRLVTDFAEKVQRIETMSKESVNIHFLANIINQVVRIIHDVCRDGGEEYGIRIEAMIRDKIRVNNGPQGTDITPDADVVEMDSLIPLCEGETKDVAESDADLFGGDDDSSGDDDG